MEDHILMDEEYASQADINQGSELGIWSPWKRERHGTIIRMEYNPFGQEAALVQFDDVTYQESILTIQLALIAE